jgi:cytochrome c oxidase subunit 1
MVPYNDQISSWGLNQSGTRLILAHILTAFGALFLGAVAGLLQVMVRDGMITLPGQIGYYQLLTAHGVLMALVFTTFFIIGFLYSAVAQTLGQRFSTRMRRLGWVGYFLMVLGVVFGVIAILANQASVLYTFYAPMKASPLFYTGLALVVVGSWCSGLGMFMDYTAWRKAHRGQLSPLMTFMAVITMVLWISAPRQSHSLSLYK